MENKIGEIQSDITLDDLKMLINADISAATEV
jgi:hypothetical protein